MLFETEDKRARASVCVVEQIIFNRSANTS